MLIGTGIALNVGAYFITTYITSSAQGVAGSAISAEANPLIRLALSVSYLSLVIHLIAFALILGLYFFLRDRRLRGEGHKLTFDVVTLFVFLFFLYDFLNDLAVLLHYL